VSGEQETYQQVLPLLQKIGSTVFWMDAPGQATRMKLINNLVLGSFMATCAEAVALSESAGIAREEAIRILLAGAGNSMVLTAKKQKLADLEFSAQFSSALIYKDLHYLQDLCRELRRPLVTGSMVKEMYAIARSKGIENEDFSSIYRIFRDL
jgi:3-hydroxyisobutyrate dehydrogenase